MRRWGERTEKRFVKVSTQTMIYPGSWPEETVLEDLFNIQLMLCSCICIFTFFKLYHRCSLIQGRSERLSCFTSETNTKRWLPKPWLPGHDWHGLPRTGLIRVWTFASRSGWPVSLKRDRLVNYEFISLAFHWILLTLKRKTWSSWLDSVFRIVFPNHK